MTTTGAAGTSPSSYRHEAVLWQDLDEFLGITVPFVLDGLAQENPVFLALGPGEWTPLREALGGAADSVTYVDMAQLVLNPARILPAWHDFMERNGNRPARGIGAPVAMAEPGAHLSECLLNEALFNVAFPADTPLWVLCPYRTDHLDAATLAAVRATHPLVTAGDVTVASSTYTTGQASVVAATAVLDQPSAPVEQAGFGRGDLARVRRLVGDRALAAGLPQGQADDLALAVNEIAANSIDHGGGRGSLRLWASDDAFVVEVRDRGWIRDPLAGRTRPDPTQLRGRGLWMVNQLCDLMQIRSTAEGTVVRITTWR